jgi:Domain of unknown function (DUF1905)
MTALGLLTITGELEPRGPAAAFILTDDQVQTVGEGAKRFPVLATINGQTLRLSIARMRGEYLLGLSKANREAAGVQAGDTVTLELALDAAPREVTTPAALAQALAADPAAQQAFDRLAFTRVFRELTGHGIGRRMHEPPTAVRSCSPTAESGDPQHLTGGRARISERSLQAVARQV